MILEVKVENTIEIEKVGPNFNLEKLRKVQDMTKLMVEEVASRIFLGMSEEEGFKIIENVFSEYGVGKTWHPNKFRIGKNTTKAFREKSDKSLRLKENDIFFIDIGPVYDEHEGDYGKTFVFGKAEQFSQIISDLDRIFESSKKEFLENNLTGKELYEYCNAEVEKYGHTLNMQMRGHRLGDFPHAVNFKGKLSDIEFPIAKNLWVLELLIMDKTQEFGAFKEDLI